MGHPHRANSSEIVSNPIQELRHAVNCRLRHPAGIATKLEKHMQKSRSLLAAVAALVGQRVAPNFFLPGFRAPRLRTRKVYPEQSSRQALRLSLIHI